MKDRRKGELRIPENMPCYAFIVCDLTERIRTQALRHHFVPTPDNEGYIGFSQHHALYTEIISYKKLLADASKRNKVLFDKLGIL